MQSRKAGTGWGKNSAVVHGGKRDMGRDRRTPPAPPKIFFFFRPRVFARPTRPVDTLACPRSSVSQCALIARQNSVAICHLLAVSTPWLGNRPDPYRSYEPVEKDAFSAGCGCPLDARPCVHSRPLRQASRANAITRQSARAPQRPHAYCCAATSVN